MNVDPLAVEAHDKGEIETDTFHTIEFLDEMDHVLSPPIRRNHHHDTNSDDDDNDDDDDDDDDDSVNNDNEQPSKVRITKRSRVNNDVVLTLELGLEKMDYMNPGHRPRKILATGGIVNKHGVRDPTKHLHIKSSLQTDNGLATIIDIKTLIHERRNTGNNNNNNNDNSNNSAGTKATRLRQELTISNKKTGKSHTTTRYFLPYKDVPPHLVADYR
jgi:hypothetical protein